MTSWSLVSSQKLSKLTGDVACIYIGNNVWLLLPANKAIMQYQSIEKTWKHWMDYTENFNLREHSAMFDERRQCVYVGDHKQLLQIDIKQKKINILLLRTEWLHIDYPSYTLMFIKNDEIYNIREEYAGFRIFDTINRSCRFINRMSNYTLSSQCVVMNKRNSMITIALKHQHGHYASTILEYSFKDEQWIDWNICDLMNYGHKIVKTRNEDFLILIDGYKNNYHRQSVSPFIFVVDVRRKKLNQCTIKIPFYLDSCDSVTVSGDKIKDELLVFGYVNGLWKAREFSNLPSLPFYLNKLIAKWVCFECINLIGHWQVSRFGHWKIDIDQILQSIHE